MKIDGVAADVPTHDVAYPHVHDGGPAGFRLDTYAMVELRTARTKAFDVPDYGAIADLDVDTPLSTSNLKGLILRRSATSTSAL